MAKITQAEVEDMRKAKSALETLQHQMGTSDGAAQYLSAVSSTGAAFGALDGNGQKITEFISARHAAVTKALVEKATPAVQTAIGMLQTTITNYETNEKTQKTNADNTPTGKSGANSGGSQRGMG